MSSQIQAETVAAVVVSFSKITANFIFHFNFQQDVCMRMWWREKCQE